MKRGARRLSLATAVAGCLVIAGFAITHGGTIRDNAEAWRFVMTCRKTKILVPRPGFEGLKIVLAGGRTDPGWLLRFVADYSGKAVIIDFRDLREAREKLVYIRNGVEGPSANFVLAELRSNGWRIVEQSFPRPAYVVVRTAP